MGRPAIENQTQIQQLKNHHKSMARDIIATGTLRNIDLARIYNLTEAQVSIIINSPAFKAYLAELETQVEENICELREDIRLLVPRASQIIKEELYNDSVDGDFRRRKMRLETAFEIWDRDSGRKVHGESGAKSVHYHDHKEIHINQMSTDDLRKDVFDLINEES